VTMDLSNAGFFKAYLQALSDKQLKALEDWNTTRVAEVDPSVVDYEQIVSDAISKKRMIWEERRGRLGSSRS